MLRWLMLVFATSSIASCAAHATPPAPAKTADPPVDLDYTFRYVGSPSQIVEVLLDAPADPSGVTTFSVSQEADVSDPETSIKDMRARLRGGGELAVEARPPHSWRVRAPAGSRVELRYQIFSVHVPTASDRFRTIVTTTLVHFIGDLALAAPEHLTDNHPREIHFAWQGLEAVGLRPATSFGAHAEETVHDTVDKFRKGVFLATDDLRLISRPMGDGRVEVAIAGKWKFGDRELVDKIARLIAIERAFFADPGPPYYFVAAWQIGKGPNFGGSAYTHSFDLAMSDERELDDELVDVLAHEYFHNWNGEKIEPEAFEELTYWVTEGFTVFYAARLRYRAGMLSLGDYAGLVTKSVRDYLISPVRELPNARIARGFWSDEKATGKLPYYRGNMIALVADREIRRESEGQLGLDDIVRALASASDPKITSERVIAMIEGLTSTGFAARVRATAIDGALLPIPSDLFAPCLVGTMTTVYAFDLGFDWDASHTKNEIVGVRAGTAAAKAGVHDGDKISGVDISFGDADKPVRLGLGTPQRRVEYMPRGQGFAAPEFVPGDAKACDAILGKPIHP